MFLCKLKIACFVFPAGELIAPTDLEIERQFAEEGGSSVAVCWAPPPCHVTGYTLYLNGDQCASVEGADHTTALLGNIPRTKVCTDFLT